jgi:hypothetical protein
MFLLSTGCRYQLAQSTVQSAVMSAGGAASSAAGDKAWAAYKQAKVAAQHLGEDEQRSLVDLARRNGLQAIDSQQLQVCC